MLNARSITRLHRVRPSLVKVITEAEKESPYHFEITHGVRTVEEQQALYAIGRTKPGAVVTQCDGIEKKSEHQLKEDLYGDAVDIVCFKDGAITWDPEVYKAVGAHVKAVAKKLKLSVKWGGDFKSFKDYPHYQTA